jgi:ribosomal-protein-alanine N-acetyltransferase
VTIDVAKECRRRGIGDLLLAAAEGWLVGSGAAAMMLHVYVQNAEAVRFYERTGYERGGEKPGFYGPGIDAALYWKRLPR